jgi:secreted trypsin-like serine protease
MSTSIDRSLFRTSTPYRFTVTIRQHRGTVAAVVAIAIVTTIASPAAAIHRGYHAPISTFRFMVSLRLAETPESHRCGGTLIEPDMVLTAVHCVARVPDGALVAVVGSDIPQWADAPRVASVGHRFPASYNPRFDDRDDIAVVRLASAQATPGIRLASREPRVGDRAVTAGWGCTNAPPVCRAKASSLQASSQTVLRDRACGLDVFWTAPVYNARTNVCTKGTRLRSTVNRGDSGGPLLVRDGRGNLRQVGVTALGADSSTKLYAGFTSIAVERAWIARTIDALRTS